MSATARPPSETSWTSEQRGAARQRNSTSAASAVEVEAAGRPPTSPKRASISEPASATGEALREQDRRRLTPARRRGAYVLEQADAADDGRRVDRAPVGLVVERDVAGDDRHPQRLARLGHPLDRLDELPGDRALLRVAEVEAVGEAERLGAGAGDVPRRLEHGQLAARARVEPAHPAGAVERQREAAVARLQPQHGRIDSGPPHRARADEVVVALVDRGAAAEVLGAEQLDEGLRMRGRRGILRADCGLLARHRLDAVARALVGEQAGRDLADDLVLPERAQEAGVGDLADDGVVQLPALADGEHVWRICGRTTATIRSWLSEIITSHGSISSSRSGTWSSRRSIPHSRAISESEEARPAAPQSCSDSTSPTRRARPRPRSASCP